MSNPKRIEELTEATNLHDNDLMFASVQDSGNTYVSKKVTLANIANYVRNGMEIVPGGSESGSESESGFGGYEIYDTSEEGDGTCNSQEELDAYCADDSRNLLFDLPMYSSGAIHANFKVKHFEKTVSKDCLVVFDSWDNLITTYTTTGGQTYVTGDGYDLPNYSDSAYSVFIDDKQIRLQNFAEQDQGVKFYLKAGQKITIDMPSNWGGGHVSIIPLKSGGKFFIDTTKSDENFKKGQMTALKTSTSNSRYTYTYTNDLDCTVLFCSRFPDSFTDFDDRSTDSDETYVTINGKKVHIDCPSYGGAVPEAANMHIILEPDDTFQINTTKAFSSGYTCYYQWNVYPIIVDENGSGSGSGSGGNKSCGGYEFYDTSEGNGTFSSIEEYQNSPYNYLFYYTVSRVPENEVVTLEKTVTKDCAVFIYNPGGGGGDEYYEGDPVRTNWGVFINNRRIPTACFQEGNGDVRHFYLKKNQTIKLELRQSWTWNISIIPLISGAKFFIDPSNESQIGNETINGNKEFTFQRPTLFSFNTNPVTTDARCSTIDGKSVYPIDVMTNWTHFILNPNQQFIPVTGTSNPIKWYAIPLLGN